MTNSMKWLVVVSAYFCAIHFACAKHDISYTFPTPSELEPNVRFWKRVYSEWTTEQIVFTDEHDLNLIYKVIDVPSDTNSVSKRLRSEKIKATKEDIRVALAQLDALRPQSEQEISGLAHEIFLAIKDVKRADKFRRMDYIRAQNGLKNRFELGYYYSGAHVDEMKLRFREAGLPEELIAIVLVESLFYPTARSHAGAAGLWQFLRGTAKEYMSVNDLVDERFDPIIATESAIQYLKSSREKLVAWPLVITSYNYGRTGMMRAMNEVDSKDFNQILRNYQHDRFGFASRNYYAEFLAALEIYREAKIHFPKTIPMKPWEYEVFTLKDPILSTDLSTKDTPLTQALKDLNPALTKDAQQGKEVLPAGFSLRIPSSSSASFTKSMAYHDRFLKKKAQDKVRARHKANGKQTLSQIASLYDVFHDQLADRLGYSATTKPKKGTIIYVRSADSRFTQIPEPLYQPERKTLKPVTKR